MISKKLFKIGFFSGTVLPVIIFIFIFLKFHTDEGINTSNENQNYNLNTSTEIKLEDYQLITLNNNNKVDLNSLEGKPIIINFWGTFCSPCKAEFPVFELIKNEMKDEIQMIMISDESIKKILRFKNRNNYTFTFLKSEKTFQYYGISVLPTTLFYDKTGKLVSSKVGTVTEEELRNTIKKLNEE